MLYELGSWGLGVGSLTPESDLDQNTEYKLSQSNCAPEYTSDKKQFLSQLHTLTSVNIFAHCSVYIPYVIDKENLFHDPKLLRLVIISFILAILTLYTLTSVCIFSIQLSIHFLRC